MLALLAHRWRSECITPAPELAGYWNVDEPTVFHLVGLGESPATTRCPFWLESRSPPARLYPLSLSKPQTAEQGFYLEVQAVAAQQLCLALWVKYPADIEPIHRLTYTLTLDEARRLGVE